MTPVALTSPEALRRMAEAREAEACALRIEAQALEAAAMEPAPKPGPEWVTAKAWCETHAWPSRRAMEHLLKARATNGMAAFVSQKPGCPLLIEVGAFNAWIAAGKPQPRVLPSQPTKRPRGRPSKLPPEYHPDRILQRVA